MTDNIEKVSVPEGQRGNFCVQRFVITDEEVKVHNLRAMCNNHGLGNRGIPAGTYTRLMHGKKLIMSDTPAEMRDHDAPVRVARGRCLINGLGLGVVLQACLQKSEVEHVTVVEVSQDVVDLVAPHYFEMFGAQRLEVICADAYEFKPSKGIRYGMVWNDIWIDITTDNYEGMKKLHRKYGRSSDWVGSWMRHEIKTQFLREQREAKMWGR